jgi:hypothetical protein
MILHDYLYSEMSLLILDIGFDYGIVLVFSSLAFQVAEIWLNYFRLNSLFRFDHDEQEIRLNCSSLTD